MAAITAASEVDLDYGDIVMEGIIVEDSATDTALGSGAASLKKKDDVISK